MVKLEVKMASRVLKRLASTSPEQTLLCTGGKTWRIASVSKRYAKTNPLSRPIACRSKFTTPRVKLFSAFTSRKETSETTCEIPSSSRRCFRIGTGDIMQTQKRNGQLNASGIMQTRKRNGQLNAKAMKQTQQRNRREERERYHADPEKKRSAERKRYWEGPECARLAKRVRYGKAKRTLQNQRGHRKRTTDKVIQSYSLYEPKDIVLSEYKSGLEKAILKNSTLLVQLNDAFCKTSTKVLKKVLNVRRKKAGEFLKDVRAINAIKLEDSHLLEGVRYHTAGSEPFFYDASYNHTRQLGAIPVDLNGREFQEFRTTRVTGGGYKGIPNRLKQSRPGSGDI
ncbi:hypothetical protein EMCRGX_G016772 [Ephydatia muelleri]